MTEDHLVVTMIEHMGAEVAETTIRELLETIAGPEVVTETEAVGTLIEDLLEVVQDALMVASDSSESAQDRQSGLRNRHRISRR